MTANKGPDSDLIVLLGIISADCPALPPVPWVWGRSRAAPLSPIPSLAPVLVPVPEAVGPCPGLRRVLSWEQSSSLRALLVQVR